MDMPLLIGYKIKQVLLPEVEEERVYCIILQKMAVAAAITHAKSKKGTHLFKFLAYECEGFVDLSSRTCDGNNSFRARSIGNVYFCTRLKKRLVKLITPNCL